MQEFVKENPTAKKFSSEISNRKKYNDKRKNMQKSFNKKNVTLTTAVYKTSGSRKSKDKI